MKVYFKEFWEWLVDGDLVPAKLYVASGFLAAIGLWYPRRENGGLPGNTWFWSALVCLGVGTILRMEHWTHVALLLLVVVGVGTLAIGARVVFDTPALNAPQASVLVVLVIAITVIFGLGIYGLSRSRGD